jgi:dipeptidase E
MKLLLTSGGVQNPSIENALVQLLGKPIVESDAVCIPTAMYAHPAVGPGASPWRFISGNTDNRMVNLGWKSMGVLELTALPSLKEELWVPLVQQTDALLVGGGDVLYLSHWIRESGLADLLPSLQETTWVGLSAGSMVMSPQVGEDFIQWRPPGGDLSTLSPRQRPRHAREHHGRGRGLGSHHRRPGIRRRRPDRNQGHRRRGRDHLRRALEATIRVKRNPQRRGGGPLGDALIRLRPRSSRPHT